MIPYIVVFLMNFYISYFLIFIVHVRVCTEFNNSKQPKPPRLRPPLEGGSRPDPYELPHPLADQLHYLAKTYEEVLGAEAEDRAVEGEGHEVQAKNRDLVGNEPSHCVCFPRPVPQKIRV